MASGPESRGNRTTVVLVVLLVVVGLAFLWTAATLVLQLTATPPAAKPVVAGAQLTAIRLALEMYYADLGRFPTQAEGLAVLLTPVGRGPYIAEGTFGRGGVKDPWGRPYLYTVPTSGAPVVTTLGADGAIGGTGQNTDMSTTPILSVRPSPQSQPVTANTRDKSEQR